MEKELLEFERNLLWLGNILIAVICLALFIAAPHMPSLKKAPEPMYKLSQKAYMDTVKYIVNTGETQLDGEIYTTKVFDLGYQVPPHGVLPHQTYLYANVVWVSRQPRMLLTVHYVLASGKANEYEMREYKFHTHYFYADYNFDGRPDKIQKRYIETNYCAPGAWLMHDFKADHWGYWDKYLVMMYRMSKEANNDMENLDGLSYNGTSVGYSDYSYNVQ